MDYHFGFADIEHKFKDNLIEMMSEYDIKKYIIALEKVEGKKTHIETKGEHIHFVIYTDPKIFKRFKETLKNKYLLSGKNGKTGRYAGWINKDKVKNEHKFMSYTVKDNNITWLGFTEDEIKTLLDDSFQKHDTLIDELMKYLLEHKCEHNKNKCEKGDHGGDYDMINLQMEILKFHMIRNKRICKSQLKNIALTYLQLYMESRFTNEGMEQVYAYTMYN